MENVNLLNDPLVNRPPHHLVSAGRKNAANAEILREDVLKSIEPFEVEHLMGKNEWIRRLIHLVGRSRCLLEKNCPGEEPCPQDPNT